MPAPYQRTGAVGPLSTANHDENVRFFYDNAARSSVTPSIMVSPDGTAIYIGTNFPGTLSYVVNSDPFFDPDELIADPDDTITVTVDTASYSWPSPLSPGVQNIHVAYEADIVGDGSIMMPSNTGTLFEVEVSSTLSNPTGTADDDSTASGAVDTNYEDGIVYAGLFPAAASNPSAADIIAGTGDVVATDSTTSFTSGTATVSLSHDLSDETQYKIAYVQALNDNGSGAQSSVSVSASFNYSAGGSVTRGAYSVTNITHTGGSPNDLVPVTIPTGAANSLVLAVIACDGTVTAYGGMDATTEGWTNIVAPISAFANPGYQIAYKAMGGTPDTTVNVRRHDQKHQAVMLIVLSGVNATVLNGTVGSHVTFTSGLPDPASHTTAAAGGKRIIVVCLDDVNSAANLTAPSGFGDVLVGGTVATGTDGSAMAVCFADNGSAAALDPGAFGGSHSGSKGIVIHFAVRAA